MENSELKDPFLAGQAALQAEVEKIRLQNLDTQTFYMEVCMVMFFRYGITPTSNKLYQLVRKGSMSAPAEALNRFWQNLRDKSRVRIEQADLPDALRETAGQLIAELWKKSQAEAQQLQAVFRQECNALVEQAQQATHAAQLEIQTLENQLADKNTALATAATEAQKLQQALAVASHENAVLQEKNANQLITQAQWQEDFKTLQIQHAAELDKQHQQAELVQQQQAENTKRMLVDIDRERVVVAKLQKSLEQAQQAQQLQAESAASQQNQLIALEAQLAQSKQAQQSALGAAAALEAAMVQLQQQQTQANARNTAGRSAIRPARVVATASLRKVQSLKKNRAGR